MRSEAKKSLTELATSSFSLLCRSEEQLLEKVTRGEEANYQADDALNDRANGDNWGEERTLRAELIVWLCTDSEAVEHLTHRGLEIVGAKISGRLNLEFASLDFPLIFRNCHFTEAIILKRAKLKFLNLSGSYVASSEIPDDTSEEKSVNSSLEAIGIQVESDVFLIGFKAKGKISLLGATIGGNLVCDSGEFDNPKGYALSAQSAEIKGFVFFCKNFTAKGEVSLFGATIGGNLECDSGEFDNPKKYALLAENAEIKGNVFLHNKFKAKGKVWLFGATIGGSLVCDNGEFDNPKEYALVAQSAEIQGSVWLRNGFKAKGVVRLNGATIGGNLECDSGEFDNLEGDALLAENAEIKGSVFLRDDFKAKGNVSFKNATIDDLFILKKIGGLRLNNVQIKFSIVLLNIDCLAGIFFLRKSLGDSHNMSLDLRFATIGTLSDEKQSWPGKGKLYLDGLVYEKIDNDSPHDGNSRLDWLRLQYNIKNSQQSPIFSPQPYEQLAKVLQESGYEEEATKVLIGKQKDRRLYGELNCFSKLWNRFLGITIGHGYRSSLALVYSLGFVVLGVRLFTWGDSWQLITPSEDGAFELTSSSTPAKLSEDYPKFHPFFYSLDVFIPIVDLHQQSKWLPNANRGKEIPLILFKCKTGSLLRYYFWAHIILGWILTSLWVAGFTGLVRSVE